MLPQFLLFSMLVTSVLGQYFELFGNTYETVLPCENGVLTIDQLIGGPPSKENFWNGSIDLSKYKNLPEVRITLRLTAPATVTLDEEDGRLVTSDNAFHMTFYKKNYGYLRKLFYVQGRRNEDFPHLAGLSLNGDDICPKINEWTPTYLRARRSASTDNDRVNKAISRLVSSCGHRLVQHQGLITNGFPTQEGDWPWHAAIYHTKLTEFSYKCGGTLISSKVVVTAGHCVVENGYTIVPERILIKLGLHSRILASRNTQEFIAYKVIPHEEFNIGDLQNDIALLKLGAEVQFSNYIQPACLWNASKTDLNEVIHENGFVIGWGFNERDDLTEILSQGIMPVVSFSTCLKSNRNFFGQYLSDTNYCAGFRNGTSVCNGDSGGGMFFEKNGVYYFRGLVSLSVSRTVNNQHLCNTEHYVLFTDTAKFLDWIITTSTKCDVFQWKCKNGDCINIEDRCNGVVSCRDSSDESVELCGPPTPAPSPQAPVDDAVTPHVPGTDRRSCPAIFDNPNIGAVHVFNSTEKVNNGEIIGEFQQIFYRCKLTYVLVGEKDNICMNGQWRYPIPKCLKGCSSKEIEGVTFTTKCTLNFSETACTGLILPDTRVYTSCSTGYEKPLPKGLLFEDIQCLETGEWDNNPESCVQECGKVSVSAKPFNVHGYLVNVTKVPWHAAIYKSAGGGEFNHICGGTIYSAKLVISAAHCFWDEKRDKLDDSSKFSVGVGKYFNYYDANEPLVKQFFIVSEIHIPTSYRGASTSYENDIAILVLNNYILYRDHIKPICIRWSLNANRDITPGTVGRIAAWGQNYYRVYSDGLKAFDLPAFNIEECQKNDPTLDNFITGEKFCVGYPNDTSFCEGDSGSGYVVKDQDTGIYYLRGVLSDRVGLNRTCKHGYSKIFTNIQYHKEMITDYELRFRPK